MAYDSNCISDLCKMNKGKSITVYCTFTDSAEWHDKVFKGILYSAGDDNIIIIILKMESLLLLFRFMSILLSFMI